MCKCQYAVICLLQVHDGEEQAEEEVAKRIHLQSLPETDATFGQRRKGTLIIII